MGGINDSAARRLRGPTHTNEARRSLRSIGAATYEILKWARQQHSTRHKRAGPDPPQQESEEENNRGEQKK